jgi:hypothetical protein
MSIAVRKQLAAELARMREATKRTQADVAASGIAVVETIRSIERAERPIKPSYVKLLCQLYEADQETTDRLQGMAMNKAKGWWESYSGAMNPKFRFFIQAEAEANEVWTYDSELLYGLLQTPAYHRAVYDADPALPADLIEREVKFRMERQKAALGRTPPLRITTILNAATLERRFPAMDEQRSHLQALNLQVHIDLSVLPWDAGPHAAMSGSFKILRFDLPDVPDVAYTETSSGVYYTEEKDVLQLYSDKFRHVREQAISLEEYLQ